MNESDSGDDDEGRVWLWGISELQCLSLFTQISIFNVYIDFCFFDVCIIICFFNVYTFLCFLNVISTSAFFDVLHQHMLFNVYANFVFLMLDQQLFASVSQKSKFSRQYLVCLSFGTNIRLCHRSALSAQTISQSSLNIVSGEFFLSYLGGW